MITPTTATKATLTSVDDVVIRFAGDSGDGMQLTGNEFTKTSAIIGNDIATFPDFPAEIRAPAGTLPGVSGFQVRFASRDIHSPGDAPDCLVAMNPAALKVNYKDVKKNGILIINTGNFSAGDLKKANYDHNPLESHDFDGWRVVEVDLNKLTREALKDTSLDPKETLRCKNFFALGMTYWLFNRPLDTTIKWIQDKFKKKPEIAAANEKVLRAGFNYCDIVGLFQTRYDVAPAKLTPGTYRNIMGNEGLALGLVAASRLTGLKLMLGSYPITPASDILHQMATYKNWGIMTFQAEDEIAAVCAAIGASYAGDIGVTTTSGPGVALKSEAMNLAVMLELPLVVIDVQRGGPSTGLPTKTEQADLLQALWGRNSESPMPVIAASTPGDCFETAIEAVRLATKYMTPIVLLSDGYIANGSEPWRLPAIDDLTPIPVKFWTDPKTFQPYQRDPKTLARPWAKPGTPGLEHRIGGIEKQDITGNVSYDAHNHEHMCRLRAEKIERIANDIPLAEVQGAKSGRLLVLSWGSTRGAIAGPISRLKPGTPVGWCHLRYLNPLPRNLGDVLARFDRVLVPELNLGQLSKVISAKFGMKVIQFNKVQGRPFMTSEIDQKIQECLED